MVEPVRRDNDFKKTPKKIRSHGMAANRKWKKPSDGLRAIGMVRACK